MGRKRIAMSRSVLVNSEPKIKDAILKHLADALRAGVQPALTGSHWNMSTKKQLKNQTTHRKSTTKLVYRNLCVENMRR